MPQEDKSSAFTQTGKKKKRGKKRSDNNAEIDNVQNKEKERRQKEDKEKQERNREEKEKRQKILTARLDNLVERMSNESMDERFGSELIS